MENRITTKDVPLGNNTYRIRKSEPRAGCWMFALLGTHTQNGNVLSALGQITHAEFDEVQTMALRLVSRVDLKDETEFEMPILGSGGVIADPALKEDASMLFNLTGESIKFSLSPFLAESGSASPLPAK